MKTWIDRWPNLLETEEALLRDAGMAVERDGRAMRQGVVRLRVRPRRAELPEELIVTFPDSFPYFRFEIEAPSLNLPRHQNPLAKNLCVLGRSTDNWTRGLADENTVVHFILQRVADVLAANKQDVESGARPEEEVQAEPISDYYQYNPGCAILVDGGWVIDSKYRRGKLDVGICRLGNEFLQGAVLKVRNEFGAVLASAEAGIQGAYEKAVIGGRWVRGEPILEDDPDKLLQKIRALDEDGSKAAMGRVANFDVQVWALLFPEEVAYNKMGEGWLFGCSISQAPARTKPVEQKKWYKERRSKRR